MIVAGLLGLAALCMAAGISCGLWREKIWIGCTVAGSAAGLAAAVAVLSGYSAWDWRSGFAIGGEPLHLQLDAVGALFLALVSVIGAAGAVYGMEYWPEHAHPDSAPRGRCWWNGLMLSMGVVLLSANGLHFLIAWEIFTVCAYFLITLDRQRREVRAAGWLYLAASHAGTLCLFAFFALLAARTGSWELGPMRDQPDLAPLFWLALVGFGLKAGVVSAAHLAAVGACQRAQPCLRHPVRA